MSKRDWGNGFAFGIVAGFLLTPVLIFAAILFGVAPSDLGQAASNSNGSEQEDPQDSRWWLISRVVYMDDTAAQWVMTFATMFAAYLLLRTLWATQGMARDTTRIGEAQIAAHLVPTNSKAEIVIETNDGGNDCYYLIEFMVKNCGATPAYNIYSYFEIFGQPKKEMWNAAKPKDAVPGQDVKLSLSQSVDVTRQSTITHGAAIRLHVKFDTVFSAESVGKAYKTIFFDFAVIKTDNGRHVMLRHDYRDDHG